MYFFRVAFFHVVKKNETFATSGNRETQTLQHAHTKMRRTCLTADTRRWIPWHAFKTLVSEHINTTEMQNHKHWHTRTHADVHTHTTATM